MDEVREILGQLRVEDDANGKSAPFASVADPWQQDDVQAIVPGLLQAMGYPQPGEPCKRHYWQRSRGHSKTGDAGLLAAWALAFARRPLRIVAAAGDADQASYIKDAIDRVVRLNPFLDARKKHGPKGERGVLEIAKDGVSNRLSGARLDVISSDSATSFGSLPDVLLVDEWSHWRAGHKTFWTSLFSSIGKRRDAVLLVLSNAGWKGTWQAETLPKLQADPAWRCSILDGPVASWIRPAALAEQERILLLDEYLRLWLNQWVEGSGDALPGDLIRRAVRADGPMESGVGWVFFGGLDLAVKRDTAAFAVVARHVGHSEPKEPAPPIILPREFAAAVDLGLIEGPAEPEEEFEEHEGTGRLRLASVQAWRPSPGKPVDLEAVEAAVLESHRRFGLQSLSYDPHQGALMAQRLARQGVNMLEVAFSGRALDEMATALMETFRDNEIDLFDDAALLADLGRLTLARKSYGFRLDAARTAEGHADRGDGVDVGRAWSKAGRRAFRSRRGR